MAQTVYNWFQIDGDKPCHKKTFCGATEEIHDDMMYDYMTRLQASGRTVRNSPHFPCSGFLSTKLHLFC